LLLLNLSLLLCSGRPTGFIMSFGVGIGDIITVITLAKTTVENCLSAPSDFAEASRVIQSLYLMLDGIRLEYQNSDSPLRRDERTRTDFAIHFKNCETSLKPLAERIAKYASLGGSKIKMMDRLRLPKKELLELRGNLAFYTARLSEFLHMIGLGAIGRVEKKLEDVKDLLPELMTKIDQMCAEVRIMGDKESLLSDHTDDDKLVWKTFRTKLNNAGFTSSVLREHEASLFLRVRELTECGLFDSDAATEVSSDYQGSETPNIPSRGHKGGRIDHDYESEADSEKTITPKPSINSLRKRRSRGSIKSRSSGQKPELNKQNVDTSYHTSWKRRSGTHETPNVDADPTSSTHAIDNSVQVDTNAQKQTNPAGGTNPSVECHKHSFEAPALRVWRDRKGTAILKATIATEREGFVVVHDCDNQEVMIPCSNLSKADLEYIKSFQTDASSKSEPQTTESSAYQPKPPSKLTSSSPSKLTSSSPSKSTSSSPSLVTSDIDVIEVPRRPRPDILVGKRTRRVAKWYYRTQVIKPQPPQPRAPYLDVTNDLLPSAAANGNLKRVKRLLNLGHNIESRGPTSWTETTGSGEEQTSTRHSYPETTALYRAGDAGYLETALFLLENGANVNTRNGWDGRVGEPILSKAIRNGDEKMTRLLLEYGARQEYGDSATALHEASSYSKSSVVRALLDHGAKIDALDNLEQTPLYNAAFRGHASIVKLLLEEGARCNTVTLDGQSPLYKAAGRGKEDVVRHLLRYGADASVGRGRHGETTMYKAAWNDYVEIVCLLLDYGADCDLPNELQMASYRGLQEKVLHGIVAGIGNRHALMNGWGKTALHAAAYRGFEDIVQVLVESGAQLEATGSDGQTPMYLAAHEQHRGVVQVLLKAGAAVQPDRHDPVLALLGEEKQQGESREMARGFHDPQTLARIGTTDILVGFVAQLTQNFSRSRR
jgi:ankyrin repeat protein